MRRLKYTLIAPRTSTLRTTQSHSGVPRSWFSMEAKQVETSGERFHAIQCVASHYTLAHSRESPWPADRNNDVVHPTPASQQATNLSTIKWCAILSTMSRNFNRKGTILSPLLASSRILSLMRRHTACTWQEVSHNPKKLATAWHWTKCYYPKF